MSSAGHSSQESQFASCFVHKGFKFVEPALDFEIPEFIGSNEQRDEAMYDANMTDTIDLAEQNTMFAAEKSLWSSKKEYYTVDETENKAIGSSAFVLTELADTRQQPVIDPIQLTEEQKAVVTAVSQGQSVFLTGNAGTGKTFVLQKVLEMLPPNTTVVTAATGVAACQISGMTLHSFAGFGIGGITKEACLKLVRRKKKSVGRWKRLTHLVIDEISMIDGDYFTCLEYVARQIRDKNKAFGGIILIVTGDFLQLPPIPSKGQSKEPKFCFESPAWSATISTTILLKEVRRKNDDQFIRLLQETRIGRCPPWVTTTLQTTRTNCFPREILATRLCTHTADADGFNEKKLRELKGREEQFWAIDSGPISECPALVPQCLILKVNAQVMLTKNLDLTRGLSNGSRGVVTGFSTAGFPLVKFLANKKPIELYPKRFQILSGDLDHPVIRRQIPLQLAWAVSIHKSQGMTLDAVEMDLRKAFADGQAYVALSRARSLNSLKIDGFHSKCVRANKKALRFYETLIEHESGSLQDAL